MNTIVLSLVTMESLPGKPEQNVQKMISYLEKANKDHATLVIFPECSLTGYDPENAMNYSLKMDDHFILMMEEKASTFDMAVCFGYMERLMAETKPFITQELFFQGKRIRYHKTHLGTKEEKCFQSGVEYPVMDISVTAGIQLCWESHIPDISTALRQKGAELLLVPYASGMSGERCRENWMVHLPARASDNGVFLAACNALFPGKPLSSRGGGLAVFNPKGKELTSYYGAEEQIITCQLSGMLPREYPRGDMHHISYFDQRKPDLYK